MIYEVEIVRVDDIFEMLEIEADTPKEAKIIALEESEILKDLSLYGGKDTWIHILYEVRKNDMLSRYSNCLNPCRHIIVRDEDGKDVYNQLYTETL